MAARDRALDVIFFVIIFLGDRLSQPMGEGLACCAARKGGWMSALWSADRL